MAERLDTTAGRLYNAILHVAAIAIKVQVYFIDMPDDA